MKAIIYNSKKEAQDAVNACSVISEPEPENVGTGIHAVSTDKPYTYLIKHPTLEKWAVVADKNVEDCIQLKAIELTEDWFPKIIKP